jgi:hypothetical protein
MNYQKIYNDLIDRSIHRIINGCVEHHHIIPRCLGGTDDKNNIARLTPEEHFLAHQLLVKIYPNNKKLLFAAQMMTFHSTHNRVNNKMFGWLKRRLSEIMSGDNNPNRRNPNLQKEAAKKRVGQKRTEETKAKMSKVQKGRQISKEHKEKLSISARNRPPITEETRIKLKNRKPNRSWLGKKQPPEMVAKRNEANLGRKDTDEVRLKKSIASKIREENKRKLKEIQTS